jgi:hypothetical protein
MDGEEASKMKAHGQRSNSMDQCRTITPSEVYKITGTSLPKETDFYATAWIAPGLILLASNQGPRIKSIWDYGQEHGNIAMISFHASVGCCNQDGKRTKRDFRSVRRPYFTKRDRDNLAVNNKGFRYILVSAASPTQNHLDSDLVRIALNDDRNEPVESGRFMNFVYQTSLQARKRVGQYYPNQRHNPKRRLDEEFFFPSTNQCHEAPQMGLKGLFLVQTPLFIQGRFPPNWWELFDAEMQQAMLDDPRFIKNRDEYMRA